MNMQIGPTTFAETLRPAPTLAEPSTTVRDAFFEIDESLGHLQAAIDVIRIVAEDTTASKAIRPLDHEYQRIRELIDKAWPAAMGMRGAPVSASFHAKFTLSLTDLIKADADYYDAMIAAEHRGEDISRFDGSPTHDVIMAARCTTLSEIRAKLHWMTKGGTGWTGEKDAFSLMLADLDRIVGEDAR